MAHRRRRQRPLPDSSDRHAPNSMDQLTLNYMEMCNMESSTGSDSEVSPRWSDTSTMGCVSSTPESGASRQALPLTHKHAGRRGCYSLCLDPYDGSSEDSDGSNIDANVSSRRTKQQGKGGGKAGCRLSGQSRRFGFHHSASVGLREVVTNEKTNCLREQQDPPDVQMECGSDSERCVCGLDAPLSPSHRDACKKGRGTNSRTRTQIMDVELQLDDSGLHITRSSTLHSPKPQISVEESSSQRSSYLCNFGSLYKRKLSVPAAEVVELGQQKKQCVSNMEEGKGNDSASEPR